MIHIKPNDKFEIIYDHSFASYDGHSLRAYTYFKEKMPDIELAKPDDKCYKVYKDNGDVVYCKLNELFDIVKKNS